MTETHKVETHSFETEARQLLDLMVHSIYSNKDIFLRELISNASDAIDKIRYESLTNTDLSKYVDDPHIRIEADKNAKTISVIDTGIGMNHDEIVEYIGTIAKSGSKEFAQLIQQAKEQKDLPPELIGQFGVGFYSSFMAGDKVTLISRSAKDDTAWKWESDGQGSYTLEVSERDRPGTTVTVHLKKETEEGDEDYTAPYTIRQIVRKYSDFVSYPIRMEMERTETPRDDEGKPIEGAEPKKIVEDETLNSMKAIWTRPESEVEDKEYEEFYKHISHDWNPPLERISYKAEGTTEFRALLFIPERAPFDLFMRDGGHGINLYIRRVFIMSDCKELIPEYLRFMRGVVDSEDLSLNISREILQKNRQIEVIKRNLVRKTLDTIKTMRKDDKEKFEKFWKEFGRVLKEGIFQDHRNQETLLEICQFDSTYSDDEQTTIVDYIERMPEDQEAIYYMTGESARALRNSPHLEAFKDKGYEVLLLSDPVDEIWAQSVPMFKEKHLQSIGKGEVELGSEEEKKAAEESRKEKTENFKSLFETLQKKLDEHVKEVRLSSRLKSSPVCLVSDQGDMTPQMEALLRASGQEVPQVKRILEVNPDHEILTKLKAAYDSNADDPMVADMAEILYGQALLAEGLQPPDPGAFSRKLGELLVKAL